MSNFNSIKTKLQSKGLVGPDPSHGDLINPFACSGCGAHVSESRLVRNRRTGELEPKENGKVELHLSIPYPTHEAKKKAGGRKNVQVYRNVCLTCVYGEPVLDAKGRFKKVSFTNAKGQTKVRVLREWEAFIDQFESAEEAKGYALMAYKQFLWNKLAKEIEAGKKAREEREAQFQAKQAGLEKERAEQREARRKGLANLIGTAEKAKKKETENGASKGQKKKASKQKKKDEVDATVALIDKLKAERAGK